MKLAHVYVRFYKSFNFDYLRKYRADAVPLPWEWVESHLWYPYVRISIEPTITTVVGANESGKSQLLSAIRKGITGQEIAREDFCRYSQFFAVETGKMRWPDFGFEWVDLTADEQAVLRNACNLKAGAPADRFLMFRSNQNTLKVYVGSGASLTEHAVQDAAALQGILPQVFPIDAEVALPDSIPIRSLTPSSTAPKSRFSELEREHRFSLFDTVFDHSDWFKDKQTVSQAASDIAASMGRYVISSDDRANSHGNPHRAREMELASDLLCRVADVDQDAFESLYTALQEGKEGYANGIIQQINNALAAKLNFPHWWVQDKDFSLTVSPRDFDLVFTIRDRTGTDYSFSERSSGLKYFLSYYVQYLAHSPNPGRSEILLMDEPDAFLSSQGQQDLLKIFEAFACPKDGRPPVQVVYVTHSPFLIDRNHAERIRVLEKGVGEEGTRIVRDASRNHYEPLRSAFGAFVAETTFIGNCNLMVEGLADQVLIAGLANRLRAQGVPHLQNLDLNEITIVPAGSASHVPYLVYLARGRDIERPALIVLLDSDVAGNDAVKRLKRGPQGKQVLDSRFILQVGDLDTARLTLNPRQPLTELEDLIPLEMCAEAVRRYVASVCGASSAEVAEMTAEAIAERLTSDTNTYDAVCSTVEALWADRHHIEKVGFAREVVQTLSDSSLTDPKLINACSTLCSNMRVLFEKLAEMQRKAMRERATERVSARVERAKQSFRRDNPTGARREQALILLEEIEAALDDSLESDHVINILQRLRRDFRLAEEISDGVPEYDRFLEALEQMKYAARIHTQEPSGASVPPPPTEPAHADNGSSGKTGETVPVAPASESN